MILIKNYMIYLIINENIINFYIIVKFLCNYIIYIGEELLLLLLLLLLYKENIAYKYSILHLSIFN